MEIVGDPYGWTWAIKSHLADEGWQLLHYVEPTEKALWRRGKPCHNAKAVMVKLVLEGTKDDR